MPYRKDKHSSIGSDTSSVKEIKQPSNWDSINIVFVPDTNFALNWAFNIEIDYCHLSRFTISWNLLRLLHTVCMLSRKPEKKAVKSDRPCPANNFCFLSEGVSSFAFVALSLCAYSFKNVWTLYNLCSLRLRKKISKQWIFLRIDVGIGKVYLPLHSFPFLRSSASCFFFFLSFFLQEGLAGKKYLPFSADTKQNCLVATRRQSSWGN